MLVLRAAWRARAVVPKPLSFRLDRCYLKVYEEGTIPLRRDEIGCPDDARWPGKPDGRAAASARTA